jgi:hypothetical protein
MLRLPRVKFRKPYDDLGAVADAKLPVNRMRVLFDGAFADIELPADDFVTVAAADEVGNLTLSAR